ncbi:carboxymuconolactone decarboxylase family protein [Granulicella arctica]|uniref:Putative peroxidase-related enzyme n=1 Tax=Granulicella arctica TaxID=940613 RepID=A0A7Y9PIR0_9BACT|nr:carboxymuconolactone decarboxylase family protein [Granulicella arctica]NYF80660.1 putative peroxidase-related enzyme [Granulicella arctica]
MDLRLAYDKLSPDAYKGLYATYAQVSNGSLGKALFELINMRVSQINGCAYCMERHAIALRAEGESDQRIDTLAGWRISPHFTSRERTALAWADAVTEITDGQAPDALFLALKEHFSDVEISDLTFAIAVMNALNRLAISMRR